MSSALVVAIPVRSPAWHRRLRRARSVARANLKDGRCSRRALCVLLRHHATPPNQARVLQLRLAGIKMTWHSRDDSSSGFGSGRGHYSSHGQPQHGHARGNGSENRQSAKDGKPRPSKPAKAVAPAPPTLDLTGLTYTNATPAVLGESVAASTMLAQWAQQHGLQVPPAIMAGLTGGSEHTSQVKPLQHLINKLRRCEAKMRRHRQELAAVEGKWGAFQLQLQDLFVKQQAQFSADKARLLQAIQDATLEEQSLKDALEKLAGQSEVSGQTCTEVPSECAALPSWLTSSGEGAVAVDDWVTSSAFPDATVQVKAEPLQSFGSPPQASHTPSHPGGRSGVLPLSPPPGDFASPLSAARTSAAMFPFGINPARSSQSAGELSREVQLAAPVLPVPFPTSPSGVPVAPVQPFPVPAAAPPLPSSCARDASQAQGGEAATPDRPGCNSLLQQGPGPCPPALAHDAKERALSPTCVTPKPVRRGASPLPGKVGAGKKETALPGQKLPGQCRQPIKKVPPPKAAVPECSASPGLQAKLDVKRAQIAARLASGTDPQPAGAPLCHIIHDDDDDLSTMS